MERLQKMIASSGYTSRRKAEELITAGRVSVNGEIVNELGFKVALKIKFMLMGFCLRGRIKFIICLISLVRLCVLH